MVSNDYNLCGRIERIWKGTHGSLYWTYQHIGHKSIKKKSYVDNVWNYHRKCVWSYLGLVDIEFQILKWKYAGTCMILGDIIKKYDFLEKEKWLMMMKLSYDNKGYYYE